MRPLPPEALLSLDVEYMRLVPADGMAEWIEQTFIRPGAPLYNEQHAHLEDADIVYLWAAGPMRKQGQAIVGQCEKLAFRAGGWAKARQEQQFYEWFGHVPEYVITFDAFYCSTADDLSFCALAEHELMHIAHAEDAFGTPRYSKQTGLPVLEIRGHDVSEFVGIVERYGTGGEGSPVHRIVRAALARPSVSPIDISAACGTCTKGE